MSTKEKLLDRFKTLPSNFTFAELVRLFNILGYSIWDKGTTSGSKVAFRKGDDEFLMHKPHPGNIVKMYVLRRLKKELTKRKLLK